MTDDGRGLVTHALHELRTPQQRTQNEESHMKERESLHSRFSDFESSFSLSTVWTFHLQLFLLHCVQETSVIERDDHSTQLKSSLLQEKIIAQCVEGVVVCISQARIVETTF